MASFRVLTGDSRKLLKKLAANSVDSCVCDPPYELGFMGKTWDKTGIANSVELWREVLRVLKPGGHLLAFGGTRTYHRMVCAIEDVGFEIRDQIGWLYGSGFPKSLDVSKAIDKSQCRNYVHAAARLGLKIPGNNLHDWTKAEHSPGEKWWNEFKRFISAEDWRRIEREVVSKRTTGIGTGNGSTPIVGDRTRNITAPATPAAKKWQGWGTALKPAWEPIVLARKPLTQRTVAENVQRFGTGAINVDACRVAAGDHYGENRVTQGGDHFSVGSEKKTRGTEFNPNGNGRWPANVIHDGSDEVLAEFAKFGEGHARGNRNPTSACGGMFGFPRFEDKTPFGGDTGTAARFFYCAKASKRDRECGGALPVKNNHPTVKPTALMRYLCKLVTPKGGTVLDPFTGSGSTGKAAVLEGFSFIGCELSKEYSVIAKARITAVVR